MFKVFIHFFLFLSFIQLIGCGGEGSESAAPEIKKLIPIASSGQDQVVMGSSQVTLTGSGSDVDGVIDHYQWKQVSGSEVNLSNTNSAISTFIAPDVSNSEMLTFSLTVTDNDGLQANDKVNITISPSIPENIAPTANAGSDMKVDEQTEVILSGKGDDSDGTIDSYTWSQTSGIQVDLTNNHLPELRFNSPITTQVEVLVFSLTVTDNGSLSDTDTISITIEPVNTAPIVNADTDLTVIEDKMINLSADVIDADGSIIFYLWQQTVGTPVNLLNKNAITANFITPTVTQVTTLTFELSATDNEGATSKDEINITVTPVNNSPTSFAGTDRTVDEQVAVILSGRGEDNDGTISGYHWLQISGTPIALSDTNSKTLSFTTPSLVQADVLSFSLKVIDNEGATDIDNINLTVNPINKAPIANAGNDKTVEENTSVTLVGSASDEDGTIVDYNWSQISGTEVNLSNKNTPTVSFISPNLTEIDILKFKLTVTDNEGSDDSSTVRVTVNPINNAPVVNAGIDQVVNEQTLVTLQGDATDNDGTISRYQWIQTIGTPVTLSNPASATTSFTSPLTIQEETLTFELRVTDNEDQTSTDILNVTVEPINVSPVVDAGINQTVSEQVLVTLNGSGSDEDGTIDSFKWLQTAGISVTLANDNTNSSNFISPNVTEQQTLIFSLTVSDNENATTTDSVSIIIEPQNSPPTANAGINQTVYKETLVTLSGVGTDIDGTIDNYLWQQVSGNPITLTNAHLASTSFIAPNIMIDEVFIFKLTVTDNNADSASDNISVLVTSNLAPIANAGPNQSTISAESVVLDASASSDNQGLMSYQWIQKDSTGVTVQLNNSTLAKPEFKAPILLTKQELIFEVTVTDEEGLTNSDEVHITITPSFSQTLTTSMDGRIIYVSNQDGDDSTAVVSNADEIDSPTNPNIAIYPFKTLAAAMSQLRDGYPDWILLKRGETWTDESFGIINKSGRSTSLPIVLSFYGGSGNRPIIKTGSLWGILANNKLTSYISILGLDFYAHTRDPNSSEYILNGEGNTGIAFVGGGSDILIEDTIVRYFKGGITVNSFDNKSYNNFTLKRSIISNNYSAPDKGHSQGIYISGVDGIVMEDNTFDLNGWHPDVNDATATMFNHNIYMQADNIGKNIIARNNIVSRASSHGIHGRAGGVFEDNLFIENSIGLQLGYRGTPLVSGTTALARNNVILSGKLMDPNLQNISTTRAVWGLYTESDALDNGGIVLAHDNIVANAKHFNNSNVDLTEVDGGTYTNNIMYNWNDVGDKLNPQWKNPDINIGNYMSSIGYNSTLDEFINQAKSRKLGEWEHKFSASAVNSFIRTGF